MAAFIEIRDVEKRYATRSGPQVVALRPTSLEIAAGEFVSIVGPSGCGKTTLMKIVAGLLPCTRGEVRLDGHASHAVRFPAYPPSTGLCNLRSGCWRSGKGELRPRGR